MDAGHEWRLVGNYIAGGANVCTEWCTLCGALRTVRVADGGATTSVTFPYAYEKVSETTCKLAREKRAESRK